MKSISKKAILLPGVGYSCDRPLLYYAGKLATQKGYAPIKVDYAGYKGFAKSMRGDLDKMTAAFEYAYKQTNALLSEQIAADDDLLFIAKSVGTVVAAAYLNRHKRAGRAIYLTPLAETFWVFNEEHPYGADAISFHGTTDPWAKTDAVEAGCDKYNIPLIKIPSANHSLETGDALGDINNLVQIMRKINDFI